MSGRRWLPPRPRRSRNDRCDHRRQHEPTAPGQLRNRFRRSQLWSTSVLDNQPQSSAIKMMAWWKWPLRFALVAALAIAFVFFGSLEYALKYLHFSALSKESLIRETEVYIRDIAGGDQMACLYVVECDGEHARLELVSDIVSWDLRAAVGSGSRSAIRPASLCSGSAARSGIDEPEARTPDLASLRLSAAEAS